MTEFARMRRTDHSMRPPTPGDHACLQITERVQPLPHQPGRRLGRQAMCANGAPRDYQKPVLERAALIAAARKGDWTKLPDILAYLSRPDREEIQTVSLVRLLANCPPDDKWPVLRKLTDDPSPLVRASAAEALGERLDQANAGALIKAAGDDYPAGARARRRRPGRHSRRTGCPRPSGAGSATRWRS